MIFRSLFVFAFYGMNDCFTIPVVRMKIELIMHNGFNIVFSDSSRMDDIFHQRFDTVVHPDSSV